MSVATFSDELKIFDIGESFSLCTSVSVSKTSGTFGRITWSGDAKWIAVTPIKHSDDPLAVFKYKDKKLLPTKYITLTNITSASFFNWTNRNIAVGVELGNIYVWDLKKKDIAVSVDIEHKQSVDHICVNSDDTYLASGSLSSNKVGIHSLKTNKIVNTFQIPKSEHASSLSFCKCKKSYLAASSYESTICVWDIVRSDIVFKCLNSHGGACTDISFSPINYSVLASVSLTKTLKMYDLREKTSIFDVNLGESMHSVDMILNGDKVAVGTASGSAIIYDLRANKVSQTIRAHEGPILDVKMQVMRLPKLYQDVDMNTPDVVEIQSKTLELSVTDVFSPISRISENKINISSKNVSFHSTPKIIINDAELISSYNDSFLSKMLSPKGDKILSPVENNQLIPKKGAFMTNNSKLVAVMEESVNLEESSSKFELNEAASGSDVGNNYNVSHHITLNESILREIRMFHKEQQEMLKKLSEKVSLVEKELNEIKLSIEYKYKVSQDNFENLFDFLINNIKQEILAGNWDAKLEHICQRQVLCDVKNLINEKSEYILNEMKNYIQKNKYKA